jgi:hypothetical protein
MNADKKITLFLPSLAGGGAQKIMVYLANGFAHRGFAVDLVLVKAEGSYLHLVSDQVRVIAVSQGVAEDLVKSHNIPHNQVTTIYNPAITPELLHQAQIDTHFFAL